MKPAYPEILNTMGEPVWWNEQGVPRYVPFAPGLYARHECSVMEVALIRVRCQRCDREFDVCVSSGRLDDLSLSDSLARNNQLFYGDPPRSNNCCAVGKTMSSEPVRVLEFWRRNLKNHQWDRMPELEVEMEGFIDVPDSVF